MRVSLTAHVKAKLRKWDVAQDMSSSARNGLPGSKAPAACSAMRSVLRPREIPWQFLVTEFALL